MKVTFFNGSTSTSVTTAPQIIGVGAALPAGQEGQVLGYGPGGVPRALDAAGPPYDDTGIKQRVQTLESTVAGKADVGHGHAVSAITGLQGILDGKAAVGHQHDLAAVSGLQAALDGKASATHTHGIAGVTGLQGALDGKAATTHTHGIAGVTGLQSALDGKAAAMHGHAIAEVTGLQTALDGKAAASAIPTTEFLQDLIAAMFQGGTHTNASISYDDNAGTLNITAVGGTGGGSSLSQEEVEDFVGRLVVQGTGIAVTYDDAGNVLRIALSGESFTTAEKNKLGAIAAGATANQTDTHLLARGNHTGTQSIATIDGLQAVIDALTARVAALEAGTVVTPPDPQPQPNLSPYQPDMTTGRIAQITTSFGGRPNVIPATYYFDGQDELASMNMGGGMDGNDAPQIGGLPLGSAGAAGSIYEGYVLAEGDDFDAQPSRWSGRNLTGRYAHSALSYGFRGTNLSQDRALYIDPDFRGNRSQSPVNLGYDGVSIAGGIAKMTATPTPPELLPYLPQTYTGGRGDAENKPRLISGSLKTAPSFMLSAQADFVVECKVRLQGGLISGYWPSFWTTTFFWADMGEIDVLEAKKDSTGAMKTLMNYIVNAANGVFQSQTVSQPAIPADRWVRLAARRQGNTLAFYDDIASEGTMALRATTTAHVAQMRGAHDIRLDLAVSQEWDGNSFDISHYPASVEFDYWRAWVPATAAHGNEETLVLPAILAAPGGSWDALLPPATELYGAGSGLEQVTAAWDNHDAPGMPTRNGTTKLPSSMTVDLSARTVRGAIPTTEGGAMPLLLTYAYDDGSPVRRVMLPYYIAPAVQSLPSGWSFDEGDAVDITIPYTAFHSGNLGPHTYQITAPGLTVIGNGTTEARITGTAGTTAQITIEAENIRGQKTTVQRTITVAAAPPPTTNGYAYETWTGPAWFDLSDDSTLTRSGSQINSIANKRAGGGDLVGAGRATSRTLVTASQNGRQSLLISRVQDGNDEMPRFEALPTDPLSQVFQGDDKPRTTFTVYKPLGSDTGFVWSASAGIDATSAQSVALVRRAANASIRRAVSTGGANNDVTWGSGHAAGVARIVVERHTGTTVTVWDNSLTKVVTDAAQNTVALRTDLQFALATARSNINSIAGTQASAEYYEFIAENRAVSDADIQQAISDLAAKWGIALT